ncbi:MAG: phosphatidylserine/phosphatidylglycerophosphate/cardiolipin synthase family protein, partial [Sphaerochaetaceae bacterium]|nr:phosphatidylserine/phosphatidylglycerophosphate/cardiolipin synthase family protein [Sphaerochaetaceae bacterium]
ANFNIRSTGKSSELVLIIDDENLATQIRNHYMEIQSGAYEVTEEQARSWHTLFNAICCLICRYGG